MRYVLVEPRSSVVGVADQRDERNVCTARSVALTPKRKAISHWPARGQMVERSGKTPPEGLTSGLAGCGLSIVRRARRLADQRMSVTTIYRQYLCNEGTWSSRKWSIDSR